MQSALSLLVPFMSCNPPPPPRDCESGHCFASLPGGSVELLAEQNQPASVMFIWPGMTVQVLHTVPLGLLWSVFHHGAPRVHFSVGVLCYFTM